MRGLWSFVNALNIEYHQKNRAFLVLTTLCSVVIGVVLWAMMQMVFDLDVLWLICLVGYAGLFAGLTGGVLYLENHEFKKSE